jgi:hypothetical protein
MKVDAFDEIGIHSLAADHSGNRAFQESIEKTTSGAGLLRLMYHYADFNSVFAGGVANLAGEIAARRRLFLDPDETIGFLADRSAEVAALVFYAAIDEFGSVRGGSSSCHRSMAQHTLRATAEFFGVGPSDWSGIVKPSPATLKSAEAVLAGYCVNRTVDERELLRGLGFHLGSELLADQEFRILDAFLSDRHAGLVKRLQAYPAGGGRKRDAYQWVRVHTKVEAEHRDAGLRGISLALRYSAHFAPPDLVRQWICEGFLAFCNVQAAFMSNLSAINQDLN